MVRAQQILITKHAAFSGVQLYLCIQILKFAACSFSSIMQIAASANGKTVSHSVQRVSSVGKEVGNVVIGMSSNLKLVTDGLL
jgi:hypothetical protein